MRCFACKDDWCGASAQVPQYAKSTLSVPAATAAGRFVGEACRTVARAAPVLRQQGVQCIAGQLHPALCVHKYAFQHHYDDHLLSVSGCEPQAPCYQHACEPEWHVAARVASHVVRAHVVYKLEWHVACRCIPRGRRDGASNHPAAATGRRGGHRHAHLSRHSARAGRRAARGPREFLCGRWPL